MQISFCWCTCTSAISNSALPGPCARKRYLGRHCRDRKYRKCRFGTVDFSDVSCLSDSVNLAACRTCGWSTLLEGSITNEPWQHLNHDYQSSLRYLSTIFLKSGRQSLHPWRKSARDLIQHCHPCLAVGTRSLFKSFQSTSLDSLLKNLKSKCTDAKARQAWWILATDVLLFVRNHLQPAIQKLSSVEATECNVWFLNQWTSCLDRSTMISFQLPLTPLHLIDRWGLQRDHWWKMGSLDLKMTTHPKLCNPSERDLHLRPSCVSKVAVGHQDLTGPQSTNVCYIMYHYVILILCYTIWEELHEHVIVLCFTYRVASKLLGIRVANLKEFRQFLWLILQRQLRDVTNKCLLLLHAVYDNIDCFLAVWPVLVFSHA